MPASHPIQRRWWAEDLVRLRRADEQQRFVASQRAGRIDPNPHQIDAVVFALQRLPQGGCILADEVGLGKTIEAALVLAQLRAEGARRILIVTPKPLLGQWKHELWTLFSIEAKDVAKLGDDAFAGVGVFLVGRELAASERGAALLQAGERFDVCVIDEAHEIFAAIHKRYDRHGRMRESSGQGRMAARLRRALVGTPILMLTATPIQNSLVELWGLVQYVEPTGTLLGDLPTFRALFCAGDDRRLREGQDEELRRRLAAVCQRTLRRQAQEFLDEPFVGRHATLFGYTMTAPERALYDDVTAWLLAPDRVAFRGKRRRLLVLGFHRRMASSVRALAASLDAVAARLEKLRKGDDDDGATMRLFGDDLEDDDEDDLDAEEPARPDRTRIDDELAQVRALAERARGLAVDSKVRELVRAVRIALDRGARGEGSGKLVIFTESLATQAYLRDALIAAGLLGDGEVTLFRGTNEGPRVREALARWDDEVGARLPAHGRPSRSVAVRLALVHEFATRSKVMIASEAGAKGLNLQFCDTVVNYDLPWNPQRIEQRIGRCHRYGQKRDVTVVNFIATDNEAELLLFEILGRKLDLFGTVLDASDTVLHEPRSDAPGLLVSALAADVEALLRRVYEDARSHDEVVAELRRVRDGIDGLRDDFEETHRRTAGLIEARFDETVRNAFRRIEDGLQGGLQQLDHQLEQVVSRWLDAERIAWAREEHAGRVRIRIGPSERLPAELAEGTTVVLGGGDDGDALHLGHPLVRAAVDEARRSPVRHRVRARVGASQPGLAFVRGRIVVGRATFGGFEPVVRLLAVAVGEDGRAVPRAAIDAVLAAEVEDVERFDPPLRIDELDVDDAFAEALFGEQLDVDAWEQERFDDAVLRIERFVDDRILVQRQRLAELLDRRREAEQRRAAATGSDARARAERALLEVAREIEAIERELERLRERDDETYATWLAQAHERRYARPRVERILDVEFVLA